MSMSVELRGFDELINKFNGYDNKELELAGTLELADYMEQKASENLDKRIYSQPPSPRYRRTGKAHRGRWIKERGEGHEVKFSTEIAGAGRDYTKFLNRNSRISKLNTHFFDDAITDTEKHRSELLNKTAKKIIKKLSI